MDAVQGLRIRDRVGKREAELDTRHNATRAMHRGACTRTWFDFFKEDLEHIWEGESGFDPCCAVSRSLDHFFHPTKQPFKYEKMQFHLFGMQGCACIPA